MAAFEECPLSVHCRIMGLGERLSAPIVEAVLKAMDQDVYLLDSRDYIYTNGSQAEGDPDYTRTMSALAEIRDGKVGKNARILLFPGFICSWKDSKYGLLGRNGSDFSAALIGVGLGASKVEFWTDVDGIYTADPRIVPDAIMVNDMSYEEAMELSFFGSKVLHPKTLAPLAAKGIEAWSLNSMNPKSRGTRITNGKFESSGPIRGISCLKDTAMISVSGSGMKGKSGMAARIFEAVSRAGISMLLKLCKPLTVLTGILFSAMTTISICLTIFAPDFFEIASVGLTNTLFLLILILVSGYLIRLLDAILGKINFSTSVILARYPSPPASLI